MAFVFEELSSVEAQEIRNLVRDPVYAFQRGVAIDREHDLVFVSLGGHGTQPRQQAECPSYYNLLWGGFSVVFEGYSHLTSVDGILNVDVEYVKLQVPKKLKDLLPEIQQRIVDGTVSYWAGRLGEKVVANVQFPAVVFY